MALGESQNAVVMEPHSSAVVLKYNLRSYYLRSDSARVSGLAFMSHMSTAHTSYKKTAV